MSLLTERAPTSQRKKQSEEELREREGQITDILANQSELICRFLPDGTLTYTNEAFREFFGDSGHPRFHQYLASTDAKALDETLVSLAPEKPSASTESSAKLPPGDSRWLSWTHRALFDSNGIVREYQSVGRDVTELKAAEESLIHEKWRLDCVIEATRSGTWQWDVTTGEMICNDHWYDTLGCTAPELHPFSREKWCSMVHPEDLDTVLAAIKAHFADDTSRYLCEYRMRHRDGRWIWVHDCGRVKAGRHEDGEVLMFGIHTDITARREDQENSEYHTRLLELILSVSGTLMNTPPEKVDDAINLSLTGFGEFESVDRCYVFLFDDRSRTTWSNTHEWCAPGCEPPQGHSAGNPHLRSHEVVAGTAEGRRANRSGQPVGTAPRSRVGTGCAGSPFSQVVPGGTHPHQGEHHGLSWP